MTSQPFRLRKGGLVDRSRPVRFRFDGRDFEGLAGDTLASALLANGQHMVARSFKYHRPRGLLGAGAEDPAGLVQIGRDDARTDPNTRATEQEIYDGLEAFAQNCWPSLKHDLGAVNDLLSALFPAGFYYKTFMGPPGSWMFFEPLIRKAGGLGRAPRAPDPDDYESLNRHCDVLVVGSGPAGLMAAQSAARSGARVILVEETARLGGELLSVDPATTTLDDRTPADWVGGVEAALRDHDDVLVLTRTCAFGYYADNFVGLWERVCDHLAPEARPADLPRQRLWRIRAKQVVLATGAIERPLVFQENDRPGIMLAGAARTYLHRYGVLPGRRAVLFANNDRAWSAAFDLQGAGAEIAAIIDVREEIDGALLERAAERGIMVHRGAVLTGTYGRRRVARACIRSHDGACGLVGSEHVLACDLILASGGLSPNIALFSQSRGKLRYDDDIAAFRPGQSWQGERSAGACNGATNLRACLTEGAWAGAAAASDAGVDAEPAAMPKVVEPGLPQAAISAMWQVPGKATKAFVDLQDDVTARDLHLAVREGYRSVEHAKRYTTVGMGTDQGKTVTMNAFGILSEALGQAIPEVGVTTFRQPYKPVTLAALAGQHVGAHFRPRRTTPMHDWHVRHGALFEPVGDWLRPWVYCQEGESHHEALMRECRAARRSCGVLDASTLGKIDIRGADARTFLDRVYTNRWDTLRPGRCRYGIMLGEDGMVMDDGVTACLDDNHFHMTTTTGGAAHVLASLEDYLQTEWPDLEVFLTSVTEHWAVASLSGPESGKVMAALCDGCDAEAFPAMGWAEAKVDGVPARVFGVSFTGGRCFEINVPASYGLWLWEKVMEAGRPHGITPYGTEAMHVLRAEKGFIIVGQDTDGTVTPVDLRMDWIVKKEGDFIGRRSLARSDTSRGDRKQLVGLLTADPEVVLDEGAHVIATAHEPAPPVPMLGHVTSSYLSPNLDRSIALALVASGGARVGETLYVTRGGAPPVPVTVTETDFLATLKGDGHG